MRADDESDHRHQILLRTNAVNHHNSDKDRNRFKRDENPVNLSVETGAVSSKWDSGCGKDNRCRNQDRQREQRSEPAPAKIAGSSRHPENREKGDDDRAD